MLEEITTKAAAIAIVVGGRYLTVTDMRACNAYASACHAQLRLIGDPHAMAGTTTKVEYGIRM